MRTNELTRRVLGAAIRVHRELGPGLLESIYEECLCDELQRRSLAHRRQVAVPIVYRGRALGTPLRLDLLIEDLVVVEVKSVESVLAVHKAQLLSYLRLTGRCVGLLLNFNVPIMVRGIHRIVHGFVDSVRESAPPSFLASSAILSGPPRLCVEIESR